MKGIYGRRRYLETKEKLGKCRRFSQGVQGRIWRRNTKSGEKDLWEDHRGELPRRYRAKMLYGWDNKRFDREYWGQLERNWLRWKGRARLERIKEEEDKEEKDKESRIEEWNEEDELGNLWALTTNCRRNSWDKNS